MNIRGLANSAIQPVNKNIPITWRKSTGFTANTAGKRTATWDDALIDAQIQAVSGADLKHAEVQNIQGIKRSVYMYGNILGVSRPDAQGGDLLVFPEVPGDVDKTWLVAAVIETWDTWAHVIAVLQVGT